MAISSLDGLSRLSTLQAAQVSVKKTAAGTESQSARAQTAGAPKKAGASAPSGASGPPAGGAKPSSAAGGSSSASTSTTYEAADTNQDGVVSAFEELTYNLTHPGVQTGSLLDVRA
jgi:hypothetical protein